jgi:hypothetical protein
LDLLIHRINIDIKTEIYRKTTTTNTIIHFTSNHPYKHKIAAFRFLLSRMQRLRLTLQYKQKEWDNILHIAKTNGYAIPTITKINTHTKNKLLNENMTSEHSIKKWIILYSKAPEYTKLPTYFMTQT